MLTRRTLALYAACALPQALATLPLYINLPSLYAEGFGLSLTLIGALLLAVRLLDAVVDPLVGIGSDRWAGPRARRRLIQASAPVLALGLWGVFAPPALGPTAQVALLTASLVVVALSFSVLAVNYLALGAELDTTYDGRTRVSLWREAAGLLGVLLGASLPAVLVQSLGLTQGYMGFAAVASVLLLVGVFLGTRVRPVVVAAPVKTPVWTQLALGWRDTSLRWFLGAYLLNGIGTALPATLVVFFIQDVIQAPDQTPLFLVTYFLAGALGMPVWLALSRRWGKRRAWAASMVASVGLFFWAFFLGAGDVTGFFVLCLLSGLALGADQALPPALLADLSDRPTGSQNGLYFGLYSFMSKLTAALAAGVALPVVEALGYTPATPTAAGVAALAALYALLPCGLKIAAAVVVALSPLDPRPLR